ncbi:GNAT family N-acetyltransferase [Micromonospora craniellae]|uniref:GNAT family N-acetyltransferase n=1 Tax=Micromonospora craniellae TaxID=2294034 RepID=A0A372G3Y1_9ACTN|nr:GNAT family N-acetyltransferase [Micromonospora craniellae]
MILTSVLDTLASRPAVRQSRVLPAPADRTVPQIWPPGQDGPDSARSSSRAMTADPARRARCGGLPGSVAHHLDWCSMSGPASRGRKPHTRTGPGVVESRVREARGHGHRLRRHARPVRPVGHDGAVRITDIDPGGDEALARTLLPIQHAAYAVEASIIGDDRIPPLHETLDELRAAPLRWLGALDDGRLVGAMAWSENPTELDIDRLVVDPTAHRRGTGTALVRTLLASAGDRRVVVATGAANLPARRLYERLDFRLIGEREVIPGLRIAEYVREPAT